MIAASRTTSFWLLNSSVPDLFTTQIEGDQGRHGDDIGNEPRKGIAGTDCLDRGNGPDRLTKVVAEGGHSHRSGCAAPRRGRPVLVLPGAAAATQREPLRGVVQGVRQAEECEGRPGEGLPAAVAGRAEGTGLTGGSAAPGRGDPAASDVSGQRGSTAAQVDRGTAAFRPGDPGRSGVGADVGEDAERSGRACA